MDPHESIRRVAETMGDQFAQAGSLAMERLAEEFPALTGDPRARPMLQRAAHENAIALQQHLLGSHGADQPRVAVETRSLAREAVHWTLPVETLIECYQVAHDAVWAWWTDQLEREIRDPSDRIAAMRVSSSLIFAYVTALFRLTAETHAAEREVWLQGRALRQRRIVDAILDEIDADPTELSWRLGYDLSLWHIGMILWLDEVIGSEQDQTALDQTARALASAVAVSRPLLIPADSLTLWAWLPFLSTPPASIPSPQLPEGPVRVSIGQPGRGIDGFRATHEDAAAAKALAIRAHLQSSIIDHRKLETMTLITDDPRRVTRFVGRQLQQLGCEDDRAGRLRETVRAYLQAGSATVAADQIHLHRNTLNRRLEAAATLRGRPIAEDTLGLALALELAVLYPQTLSRSPDSAQIP